MTITHLLWLDLEGTGDDPSRDDIVEVGAVLTTQDLESELGSYAAVVRPSPAGLERLLSNDVVREMHARSGLLDLLDGPDALTSVADAEAGLLDLLDRHGVDRFAIAGSGVSHYDRPFVREVMPRLEARLTANRVYWSIDVGSVRRSWDLWSGKPRLRPGYEPDRDKEHRAVADIRDHIAEARAIAAMMRQAQP